MSDTAAFSETGFDLTALYKALFLAIVAVFVATPLIATVLGGFKSIGELRTNPFGLPHVWEWENYGGILLSKRYWQLLGNSLIISSMTVVLTLIAASMAAFVFAQIKFYGSTMLMSYITMGLLFPAATAILPLFIKVRDLGLLDSYFGVVLPQVAFALAMSILLLRRFFKDIPFELLEAALVDGCSYVGRSSPRSAPSCSSTAGTHTSFR
jgi:raffinose/stachyose/melibiose transport system permease protein